MSIVDQQSLGLQKNNKRNECNTVYSISLSNDRQTQPKVLRALTPVESTSKVVSGNIIFHCFYWFIARSAGRQYSVYRMLNLFNIPKCTKIVPGVYLWSKSELYKSIEVYVSG